MQTELEESKQREAKAKRRADRLDKGLTAVIEEVCLFGESGCTILNILSHPILICMSVCV